MAYRNGRVDVFDTMSFTAPSPLGKENALTNFELRFDELGIKGLWLAAIITTSTLQALKVALTMRRPLPGAGAAGASCLLRLQRSTYLNRSPLTARWP